jgi:hypothetical protein
LTGLTDEVLLEIDARSARHSRESENQAPTKLYQSISTMKEFRLKHASWRYLSRLVKNILHYHRIMEGHYMDQINEKHDRERKQAQQKQAFLNKLPQQIPRRGRG